jgi:hypothetical protein
MLNIVSIFIFASTLLAQSGSITGTVVDVGGDPVANATIQATNSQTKSVHKAVTSASGAFTFEQLPAGKYDLFSVRPGFEPFVRKDVEVAGGQQLRLDLHFLDIQLNTLGDGREFFESIGGPHKTPVGPAPKMPDGRPDLSGVWYQRRVVDPGNPEPLPWAEATMRNRQAENNKDAPQSHCWPLGVMGNTLQLWKLVQTPALLVIMLEGELPRQVFLDGRSHPNNLNPTWVGHSIGHWDRDTLVVDTVGFNDRSWLDLQGRPHTEKLHMTERYRRADLGHLEIEITIDDPGAYVKPWTTKSVADLAPQEEIMEYVCTENERDLAHLVGK